MLILPNGSRRLVFFAVFCVACFNIAVRGPLEALSVPKKAVLVLYGERLSIPAVKMTEQGLMDDLSRGQPGDLEIFSEYLDLSRFPVAEYEDDLIRYLRAKYAARKLDVVIAIGSSALELALAHRDELFTGVPIVFAGVDGGEVEGREIPPKVAELWMALDYQRTIELALQLQPETREIVCVAGTGPQEQLWNNEGRKVLERFAPRVRTRWLDKLPLPAVLDQVARLSPDSVVLYIPMLRDGAGQSVSPFEVARRLAEASGVAVYGLTEPQLEQGIMGGALLDFSEFGHKIATLAFRVLAGEMPPALSPPDPTLNPLLVNWRALKKWHVSESRIPAEATVRYREPSLWEQHPRLILATGAVVVLQSMLIAGLIVQRSRRKRAEELFRLVVEAAPNAMIVLNSGGKIHLANAQVEAVFGYAPQELIGHSVEMLVPERFRSQHARYRNRYFSDPQARMMGAGLKLYGRHKDGGGVPIEIGLNPICTSEGSSVLASIIDITERKQAEMEAARQRDEFAHASRLTMVGELTASIAHEINQPLGAILSNAETAEILLQSKQPHLEEIQQILADIRKDDLRASEVIRHMRELLRKHDLELKLIDLNAVASSVLRIVAGEAHRQGVEIEEQFADTLPLVRGDEIHLQQVLLNLILNGMEAMSESSASNRRLKMRTAYDGKGNVEFAIEDSGPGIPSDLLPRLFDSLFTTKAHGMGLGLSIVRSIVKAHGGRIWAENNSSGGACFRLTLPVNRKE